MVVSGLNLSNGIKKSSVELSKNRMEFNVLGLAIAFDYPHSLQQ